MRGTVLLRGGYEFGAQVRTELDLMGDLFSFFCRSAVC